jgi:hypothetical protein
MGEENASKNLERYSTFTLINLQYRVKTMSMDVFSASGKITGCVNEEGHLKLQTWREGVHKTSLNGLLVRGDITLMGKNGDGVPVKWIITIKNGVSTSGGEE